MRHTPSSSIDDPSGWVTRTPFDPEEATVAPTGWPFSYAFAAPGGVTGS